MGTTAKAAIVRLIGDFDIIDRELVHNAFDQVAEASIIIIDFSKVTYMDSTILGCLVHLRNMMLQKQTRADMRLCNIPVHLQRIFDICGFDHIFTMYERYESAIPAGCSPVEMLIQAYDKVQYR